MCNLFIQLIDRIIDSVHRDSSFPLNRLQPAHCHLTHFVGENQTSHQTENEKLNFSSDALDKTPSFIQESKSAAELKRSKGQQTPNTSTISLAWAQECICHTDPLLTSKVQPTAKSLIHCPDGEKTKQILKKRKSLNQMNRGHLVTLTHTLLSVVMLLSDWLQVEFNHLSLF